MQAVMYAQLVLDRAVQETCGLQIPCWHTLIWLAFHFSETWNFNCVGPIEVRLSMFDHGGEKKNAQNVLCPAWLTDSLSGCVT